MSNEDQIIAAGRIALERAEARKQYALLGNCIGTALKDLTMIRKYLEPGVAQNYSSGLHVINVLIEHGGLEQVKIQVEQCIALALRIAELDKAAKESGIDR